MEGCWASVVVSLIFGRLLPDACAYLYRDEEATQGKAGRLDHKRSRKAKKAMAALDSSAPLRPPTHARLHQRGLTDPVCRRA